MESGDMNTVIAYDPTTKKLVIVATNFGGAQKAFYYLNSFSKVAGPVKRWSTVFGTGEKYVEHNDATLKGMELSCDYPADSIQTLEIDGVEMPTKK